MTDPTHDPIAKAEQSLERAQALADELRALNRDWSVVPGEVAEISFQTGDPLWLSALRGRVMAAMASATSLWISGSVLIDQVAAIRNVGLHPETAAQILTQADSVLSAGAALAVAAASLIALLASAGSKLREWAAAAGIGRP